MVVITTFTEEDAQKDAREFFNGIQRNEIIEIKDAPYEDKIRFLKYCMSFTDVINASVLTNISFMVFGSKITDDTFEDKAIFFKDIEEYVDAKYDLRKELELYGIEILRYFFASIKSYSSVLPDGKIDIPGSYKAILMASSIVDMSKMMNRIDHINQIPLVFGADEVVDSLLFNKSKVVEEFVHFVMDGLKHDDKQ